MKKILSLWLFAAAAILPAADLAVILETIQKTPSETLPQEWKEELAFLLPLMAKTPTGAAVLKCSGNDLVFSVRPIQANGLNTGNTVILNTVQPKAKRGAPLNHLRSEQCFTASILAHEICHQGQFTAGFFQFPASCSGLDAVRIEKLLELQARYTGEMVFREMRMLETFRPYVSGRSGILTYCYSTAQDDVPRTYFRIFWENQRDQIMGDEARQWNRAYTGQAFRNHRRLFLRDQTPVSPSPEVLAHVRKITETLPFKTGPETFLQDTSLTAIPHGLRYQEAGKKVLEFEVNDTAYVIRHYNPQTGALIRTEKQNP